MADIELTPQARRELLSIFKTSIREYGPEVARRRRFVWDEAFATLRDYPMLGRDCDEVRLGVRRYLVSPHVAFYQVDDERVLIIRILHERQNPDEHLP